MSWLLPSFLNSPVLPSLPYDRWQALVRDTVGCIWLGGLLACFLTFVVLDRRSRKLVSRFGTVALVTLLLLPGVTAGTFSAFRFNAAFEAFQLPTAETGSYLANCALWTAVPQLLVALAGRWLYDRWCGRAGRDRPG